MSLKSMLEMADCNRALIGRLLERVLGEESRFAFATARVLQKTHEETSRLLREDLTISELAWTARNLMELRIFGRYTRASRANLEGYVKEVLANGAASMQAMIHLQNDFRREFPEADRVSENNYRRQAEVKAANVGTGAQLTFAKTASAKVGLEKEYEAFNSVLSPLIHPTALSVLKTFDLETYRPILVSMAVILCGRIILELEQHIQAHGMKTAL